MSSIVLIVDDDVPRARRTADWLIDAGHRVVHTRDLWSAAIAVGAVRAHVVVMAHQMTERADAASLARFATSVRAAGATVISAGCTRRETPAAVAEADYVFVRFDRSDLLAAINRHIADPNDPVSRKLAGREKGAEC
jgi:DNA-binding NtrC family response regulator